MKTLAKKTFTAELTRETSYGSSPLGSHESTMEVFCDENGVATGIEWDVPGLDTTEFIGLEVDGKVITGYDGIMCMPSEAIEMLNELGYDTTEVE